MKRRGSLTVVCGSMFAGKSEELIRLARRSLYARKKVQVFKPSIDDRFDRTMVVSHVGRSFEAVPVRTVGDLAAGVDEDADVVCVEEAQFFDPSLVDLATELADDGVTVICAGLDQDFRRQGFGPMPGLLAAADEVIKLRAICLKCGEPASHTYRTINGRPAHWNDPVVLIAATEAYEARCRGCFRIRGAPKRKYRG